MLSAADSVQLRVGQAAQLQIEGTERPVQARVARINPSTQAGTRGVLIYLSIADATGLRQGLFAQGSIATGQNSGLAVPLSAVRTDKPMPYVQTVEGGKVVHKSVEMGARGQDGNATLVQVKGLESGAQVIVGSVGPLRAGTIVKLTRPAGN